ncbi:MAG: metallophosphoesterase, partial [Oscillospiraceae bacterium]|nr:metallophosphoesterase [Oscillospiraceae bacterium]
MTAQPLALTLISDTHYYSKRNGTSGKAFALDNQKSQKLLVDAEETIRAAFAQIAKDGRSDIVLLSGDVVNNGELAAHEEMTALLRGLQEAGKRVFVLTATHDYDKGSRYEGDQKFPAPCAEREDLWELYYPFGPAEAIAVHRQSHSYTAQLAPGYRLLALNDDRDGTGHSGFSEELRVWIREQAVAAQAEKQFLLTMTHHPLLPPSPFYAIIGKGDVMNNAPRHIALLDELGISFCFTGHTHIQDISYCEAPSGRIFYDISTAALVGYPGNLRHIVADAQANTLEVSTEAITEPVVFSTGGGSLEQRLERQFFGMIRDVIAAAGSDIERFAEMARAFSVKPRLSYRFGWLLKPAVRWLNSLKIGTIARWTRAETGLKPEDYAAIKNDSAVTFIIDLVMHLFGGDSPYAPDTAHYKITVGLLNIIDSFLR